MWTGPDSDVRTSRLTSAVVVDLVESAGEEILLVSYATQSEPAVAAAARSAAERGIEVTHFLERVEDNPAYRGAGTVFAGVRAMHAKVLVVDLARAALSASVDARTGARSQESGGDGVGLPCLGAQRPGPPPGYRDQPRPAREPRDVLQRHLNVEGPHRVRVLVIRMIPPTRAPRIGSDAHRTSKAANCAATTTHEQARNHHRQSTPSLRREVSEPTLIATVTVNWAVDTDPITSRGSSLPPAIRLGAATGPLPPPPGPICSSNPASASCSISPRSTGITDGDFTLPYLREYSREHAAADA